MTIYSVRSEKLEATWNLFTLFDMLGIWAPGTISASDYVDRIIKKSKNG